jgi:hypothetical protein
MFQQLGVESRNPKRDEKESTMDILSVRSLKKQAIETVVEPLISQDVVRRSLGVRARRLNGPAYPRTIALGIGKGTGSGDFRLAVRVQHPLLMNGPELGKIQELAHGEADVRYVGMIKPMQTPWYQNGCRPLRIGCSVAQFNVTAGTIGAFVRDAATGRSLILSNNHVLADENRAHAGDNILQPGQYDNGNNPADAVATLTRFIPLDFQKTNYVDCAIAEINPGVQFDPQSLDQLGTLTGVRTAPPDANVAVRKLGRTTGITYGTISAIEVDNVGVGYDQGTGNFDSQIEIQGSGPGPFSDGGDSGSLIVDGNNQALGLLFAGSDQGGPNGLGLTYANPFSTVLSNLAVDLLF